MAALTLFLFTLLFALEASAQEPIQGDVWAHDPSTMIKDGNRYYIYRTSAGIMSKWSMDKVNWTYGGRVFPGGPPAWVTAAVSGYDPNNWAWAPDVAFFNGRYHLYYSVSKWGSIDSVIGLVTSPSLISPTWTDQGKVVQSDASWEAVPETDTTSINCIDPSILVETNGTIWMSYGSYSDGIMVTQLDPTTGKRLNPLSPGTRIADNGPNFFSNTTEASCLFKRGFYYYLFLNFGGCCAGTDSTYNIRVGRSLSVSGPYLDRAGNNMLDGGGTLLLQTTGRFIGPGHSGILSEDGVDWFTYHYYDGQDNGNAKLGLARLQWTADAWPFISNDWSNLSAFYTFEADARDHLALHDGTLMGGATIQPEENRGSVLDLDGSAAYVALPAAVANGNTFAAWVKWNGGGTWQRIFDFGDGVTGGSTGRYLFLSPRASSGKLRFAITTSGNGNEQIIDAPNALPTNSWTHVAVTVGSGRGVLYLNGYPVGTNSSMTLQPWEVLAHSNYLGKSQWPDPLFNGRIDSFRVYGRVLEDEEIRDLAYALPMLAHRYSFTEDASDFLGAAHGTLQGNAVVTNGALLLTGTPGDCMVLPGGLVSGCSALTVEFWATFGTNSSWARVFDFGNTNVSPVPYDYLFFSPKAGTESHRFGAVTSGGSFSLDGAGALEELSIHVVCIADPTAGYLAIYTNGVLETEQTGTVPQLNNVDTAFAYLGRSLFGTHPWLNATIDEFRIYDGRLSAEDIRANFIAGPDELALPIRVEYSNTISGWELRWPDYAAGFTLDSAQTPGGIWQPVPGKSALTGAYNVFPAIQPTSNQVFRLKR